MTIRRRHEKLFPVLAVGLVLFAVGGLQGAQLLAQPMSEAVLSPDLRANAERNGHVPVIVEFRSPLDPNDVPASESGIAAAKATIAAVREAIIQDHLKDTPGSAKGREFSRSIQRFELSPMFAANVTAAELRALASDPRVVRIHENALGRTN